MHASSRNNAGYLDQRFFLLTLAAAALLHLGGFYLFSLLPKSEIVDIPVRVLNIKLGDADTMDAAELKPIQPDNGTSGANAERALPQMAKEQEKEKARQQKVTSSMDKAMSELDKAKDEGSTVEQTLATSTLPPIKSAKHSRAVVKGKFNVRSEGTKAAAPVFPVTAHQYVRDDQLPAAAGSAGHSGLSNAQLVSRYEQLISLWIQKFKVYPADARSQGMQGETVVRIRIDRQGNILYYMLEHSTGFPLLDHAAIDMIRRANPVPAVPAGYPPGDMMEFLIPVSFHLEP